ncbi:MAG TPA: trypsin-like peptidase domain-containing protein, partial [Anaerolineales bacterium]|nr:trypsin-like peptidase domain-containing protein [Anaerolineales bacterium]
MKNSKISALIAILAGVLVTACGVFSVESHAPSLFPTSAGPFSFGGGGNNNSAAGSVLPAATPIIANPQAPADAANLQNDFEQVYQKVNASVVTIEIGTRANGASGNGFGQGSGNGGNGQGSSQIVPTALGSGVIWDGAGHVLTNNHVVQGAAKMTVTFWDGSSYDAKLIGTDPNSDLAVIQVTGAPASLIKPITVGDSTQVKVGEMVVAIGNPFGLANTMTTGIVSAIGRSISAGADNGQGAQNNTPTFSIPDVIQTDAAINPGNSGG